jgi:hypothetical protein
MGIITLPVTLQDSTVPTAANFLADFNAIYNEFNGNIDNANVKAGAAIDESKIAFDDVNGHDHKTSGKKITVNRAFPWFIDSTLVADASTRKYARWTVPEDMTIAKVWATLETANTGAAVLIDIHVNGTSIWASNQSNRLTIADGATSGNRTSFDTTELVAGDIIDIYVDQVGSTIAGAGLSVTLEAEQ